MTIGITGRASSGKSTFSHLLAENLQARLVNTDTLARELTSTDREVRGLLLQAFGPEVLDAAGEIDRPELARRVFSSDPARQQLEAILHPSLQARGWSAERIQAVLDRQETTRTQLEKADHIAWNDGSLDLLARQAKTLAQLQRTPQTP